MSGTKKGGLDQFFKSIATTPPERRASIGKQNPVVAKAKASAAASLAVAVAAKKTIADSTAPPSSATGDNELYKCTDCDLYFGKESGNFVGRAKNLFKCRSCNSCNQRCTTMMKGTYAVKAWAAMSKEEKVAFRQKAKELSGEALKECLTVTMKHIVKTRHSEFGGKLGKYLPLSVYKVQGYDEEALQGIASNAASRWDDQINQETYALLVFSFGGRDEQLTEDEVLWQMLPEGGDEDRPRGDTDRRPDPQPGDAASSRDSLDRTTLAWGVPEQVQGAAVDAPLSTAQGTDGTTSSSDESIKTKKGKKAKSSKAAKRALKKEKKAEKRQLKALKAKSKQQQDAKKIVACIAAPLKSLTTGLTERLSKVVVDMVPAYVRTEADVHMKKLQQLDICWTAVVSDTYQEKMGILNFDTAMKDIKDGQEVAKRLDASLSMAESVSKKRHRTT